MERRKGKQARKPTSHLLKWSRRIRKAPQKIRAVLAGLKLRKEISEELQALVIFLRFGSLNSDKTAWHRPSEVFMRTGVKMCTQLGIITRWRNRGFVILRKKHPGRKETLTRNQVHHIVSAETLQRMTHLSLARRSQILREELGLKSMSSKTLRNYYIKYGVKFKRPDYKYWKSLAEKNELQKDQMEFVQELGTMIV